MIKDYFEFINLLSFDCKIIFFVLISFISFYFLFLIYYFLEIIKYIIEITNLNIRVL